VIAEAMAADKKAAIGRIVLWASPFFQTGKLLRVRLNEEH
jgi:hypothetical protein